MKGEFWKSTRDQRIRLASLLLLLTVIVFWPALKHFAGAPFRPTLVQAGQLQVAIPLKWQFQKNGAASVVWKPHMTILTSGAHAGITLEVLPGDLPLNSQDWETAAKFALTHIGFKYEPTRRTLNGGIGIVTCLESSHPGGRVGGSCFEPVHGLIAGFEGEAADLASFHSIITSVHAVPE